MKDFDPGQMLNRAMPHLPLLAVWIAAIALGIQAAFLVQHLIPQRPVASLPPAGATTPPPRRVQPTDFQGILNAHLFGAPTADPTNAPQTQLSLVLTGVIANTDPEKGLGIIGENAGNTKVYAVGQPVPGGVKLHAVYQDRVVLDRNGQLETLMLPRQNSLGLTPPPAMPAAQPVNMDANPIVERMRQLVASEPGVLAEVMRPQPVFANGQQRGYRVYPGRNRQQFAKLGLEPGDLILSINGTPLDDQGRSMEIFRTMGSASDVTVTLIRAGQQQNLTLHMSQLASPSQESGNSIVSGAQPMEQAQPVPPPSSEGTP